MDMGKEVYAQKTDFIRLFWEKVVSDVSRWAWHTREQVINRKKPIFLKLALELKNSQLAARFTGRSAVLAPVEADEITGAVESAFGGDFRNGEVGIFQQFFSAGKAEIMQIAEWRSPAVVRKELAQQ